MTVVMLNLDARQITGLLVLMINDCFYSNNSHRDLHVWQMHYII